jgi:hypothetical protein
MIWIDQGMSSMTSFVYAKQRAGLGGSIAFPWPANAVAATESVKQTNRVLLALFSL